jgi:hypothetical protein
MGGRLYPEDNDRWPDSFMVWLPSWRMLCWSQDSRSAYGKHFALGLKMVN